MVTAFFTLNESEVYYPVSPLPVAKRNDALINPSRRVNYVNPGYGVTGSRRVTAGNCALLHWLHCRFEGSVLSASPPNHFRVLQ